MSVPKPKHGDRRLEAWAAYYRSQLGPEWVSLSQIDVNRDRNLRRGLEAMIASGEVESAMKYLPNRRGVLRLQRCYRKAP